jgi:ketose-bisphosphate aldolase
MPLRPVPELFARARAAGYALGYFESWNLESLQGVIDAAEQTRSPVIIGFNGEFLTLPERSTRENLGWYGALGRAAAQAASVPCGLIFNECPIEAEVRQAALAGFNLVMLASGDRTYEDYLRQVAGLVPYAHAHGAAVEAEIGELPSGDSGKIVMDHASQTDPDLAAQFVMDTQVDLLSVSVGNVHVLLDGQRDLDLERLASIRERVSVPLGLHGGTGIPPASLREAIRLGVAKVAYGTYLKQRYLSAVRQALGGPEINPHKLLGMGGPEDVLAAARLAVKEAVLERIESLGCCGKAE